MKRSAGLALFVVLATGHAAFADLATGRDKLTAGDYKTAISELGKVSGKDKTAALILKSHAQIAMGDYAGAEAALTPLAVGKDVDAHLALDHLRWITGRR